MAKKIPEDLGWYGHYKASKEFYSRRLNKNSTARNYLRPLQLYCEFRNMDPDVLLEEALDLLKKDPKNRITIINHILDFQTYLDEEYEYGGKKLSPTTIKGYKTAVQSFYSYHLHSPLEIKNLPNCKRKKRKGYFLKKAEIRRMLDIANLHEKILILMQMFTGMRIRDMLNLRVADVYDVLKGDVDFLVIRYTPGKEAEVTGEIFTLLPPTGVDWLKKYLEERRTSGEEFDENTPLFISKKSKKKPMSYAQANNIVKNLAKKTKILDEMQIREGYYITTHRLRAYFSDTLVSAGMNYIYKEYMMGHSINQVTTAYNDLSEQKITEAYRECLKDIDPYYDDEKEQLEKDNKDLSIRVDELENRFEEFRDNIILKSFVNAFKAQSDASLETKVVYDVQQLAGLMEQGWTSVKTNKNEYVLIRAKENEDE